MQSTLRSRPETSPQASHRQRRYLMCRPTHFAVEYAINPWMDPTAPVDVDLAVAQWSALRQAYLDLGHRVELVDPLPGLPDMVFAANGALVADGTVYGAQFRNPQRADEAPAYRSWFEAAGYPVTPPKYVNEGEGDLLLVDSPAGEVILAGTGFRTELAAHAEAQEQFGRPSITLCLVDPRFYHLDTALFPLGDGNVAYFPGAFSDGSRQVLKQLFPDAIVASADDAAVLGLNAVSDGRHVVLNVEATGLADQLATRGYVPVPVNLSELRKAGGGPKCCTLEIR
ncbi:MAG: amidinotransferase [Micromonosporaceae bacterium]|nr:amidinotransferase [Micromonosporaceae bacterium]